MLLQLRGSLKHFFFSVLLFLQNNCFCADTEVGELPRNHPPIKKVPAIKKVT